MSQIIQFQLYRPGTYQDYQAAHSALRARLKAEGASREEISRQSRELLATYRQQRRRAMAALDGRPVQTKAEFTADQTARKAARKGETNERTKQKIKRVAEGVKGGKINIDWYVEHAESNGLDGAKVRAFCEAKLKYPVSREEFNQWLNEASAKGRFNP